MYDSIVSAVKKKWINTVIFKRNRPLHARQFIFCLGKLEQWRMTAHKYFRKKRLTIFGILDIWINILWNKCKMLKQLKVFVFHHFQKYSQKQKFSICENI